MRISTHEEAIQFYLTSDLHFMTPFLANVGSHPWLFPLTLVDSPVPVANNYLAELQAIHRLVQLEKTKVD